jgi:hypothetical protein
MFSLLLKDLELRITEGLPDQTVVSFTERPEMPTFALEIQRGRATGAGDL